MANRCQACGSDALTYELDEDSKLVPQCLVCGCHGVTADRDPGTPRDPLAARAPTPVAARVSAPASKPRRTRPFDVLREARTRLRELHREIARLEKLKLERDKLQRLLAAAEPRGAVVPLRKAQ